MSGGPYPGQTGAVSTYVTPFGTNADLFDALVNGRLLRAIVPWSSGPGSPSVWCLHGLGDDRNIVTTGNFHDNGMTDAMLDDGFIVIATETNPQKNWGNQAGRDQHALVWAWVRTVWPQTPGPCLYGISMGGCMSLNFVLEALIQGVPISAVVLNSAVTDLAAGYNAIQATSVITAYGLTGGGVDAPYTAGWLSKTAGHDPEAMAASAFLPVPFRMYASYADGTAGRATNTDQFDAKLAAASWAEEHVVVSCAGGHAAGDGVTAWRGPWSGATTYAQLDGVSRNGIDYLCLDGTSGHDPASTSGYWTPLVGHWRPSDVLAFYHRHVPGTPFDAGRLYVPGAYGWLPCDEFVMDNARVWQPMVFDDALSGGFTERVEV